MRNNKVQLTIVVVLVLLLFQDLHGQTFNKRILFMEDIPAMDFSNILVKEDTIITIGRGAVLVPPNYPVKLMISKFDFSGETFNWFNDYGPDTLLSFLPHSGRSIYQKGNKMLIVGGSGEYFSNDFGFAAMIDNHSSIDWIKLYPPSETSYAYHFISGLILDNNDLLFLANRQESGYPEGYPISVVVIYSDNNGNILWEREYESSFAYYIPGSFMMETDTTFLIGLRITNQEGSRSTILKINQQGDILNEWQNDDLKTYSPKKILKTPDGGFVFVSRQFTGLNEGDYPIYQGYICKLDNSLNKEWDLKLGNSSMFTLFNSLIQTFDDKFIAVGGGVDTFQTNEVWRQKGMLVKFDENGIIDWQRKIISASNRFSEIYDIAETEEHGLVTCGLSQSHNEDYPHQGWLLKLDEYGCLDPAWCDSTTTIIIPPEENKELSISPNPAQSVFKIAFQNKQHDIGGDRTIKHIRIYDMWGKEFLDAFYDGLPFVDVSSGNWPPGVYVVVVNDRWIGKVLKE